MFDVHRMIGEGLFLVYLIIIIVVVVMSRRGRTIPSPLIGIAHGLLAVQVALGLILLAEDPGRVVWYHPVIGLAAILSLGLTPVLRRRLGATRGLVAALGIVATLAFVAMLVVRV
jgi:energy-converting hydrogenase Eha subunit A